MQVVAYCDERYRSATAQAAGPGALVSTSPPLLDDGFSGSYLAGRLCLADLVYLNFHVLPGQEAWINTQGDVALSARTLRALDLRRAVVYMVNCYAGGGMLEALRAAHPRAIVGGEGENLGGVSELAGADLLGLWFRRGLGLGLPPARALGMAKLRLRVSAQTASIKDALAFKQL